MLFLLEDVHWLDPTTLELIELTLDAIASERVLLLLSARPTFEHRFGGHPRVTRLMLNRLGREPSLALIERLGGGKALPGEVLDEIIRKTDGVPLFVEELTKTVLESRLLRETADAYVLDGPLASFDIPSSLQDSLMARLDRLQPVREVAQMAACIGREFDYRLLATVTRLDAQELQAALAQLIEAELIFQRGLLPDASYTFKHALVRDAAYESLLKSKRQQVHAALFNALKTGDQVAFEILAHHATAASLNDQAIDYWQKAGERALAQPALSEAVHHLRTAIQLTRSMGDARQWLERELSLQVMLAQAWIARAGYTAEETIAAFRRARELSDSLDGSPLLFPILNGHWVTHHGQARHSEALAIADEALRLARKASTDVPVMIANQQFAVSSLMTGQLSKARQHFETATGLHRPVEHAWIARQFGHEQGIAARMLLSAALWLLGYPEQSNKERSTAVQLATDVDHATTTSFVLAWSLISAHLARNQPEKQRLMQPMAAVAEKHDLALWRLMGKLFYGIAVAESGDAAGFRLIDECIEQLDGVQFHAFKPLWRTEQARLLLAHGRIDEARSVISSTRAIIASTGERWAEAETRRVEGDIRLASDSSRPGAESCYRESLAVARSQQARLWELRATTSLARLWCDQGKHQEAHDLLTPVYDWFTEGFDTADLKDARALLDTLA